MGFPPRLCVHGVRDSEATRGLTDIARERRRNRVQTLATAVVSVLAHFDNILAGLQFCL